MNVGTKIQVNKRTYAVKTDCRTPLASVETRTVSAAANAAVEAVPTNATTRYSADTPPIKPRMLTTGRPIAIKTARCGNRPSILSATISPLESWLAIR